MGKERQQPTDQFRMLLRVASLLSLFRIGDKICLFQYSKVLADVWLRPLKQFSYVLDAQRAILQYLKDGNRVGCANAFRNSAFSCRSEREGLSLSTVHCAKAAMVDFSVPSSRAPACGCRNGPCRYTDFDLHAFGDEITEHLA